MEKTHQWWRTLADLLVIDACFSTSTNPTQTSDQTWRQSVCFSVFSFHCLPVQVSWVPFRHSLAVCITPCQQAKPQAPEQHPRWGQHGAGGWRHPGNLLMFRESPVGRHGQVSHWLAKWWPHQISPTFPQSLPWEKRRHSSRSVLASASLYSPPPPHFNWRRLMRSRTLKAFTRFSSSLQKTNPHHVCS